ncbi:hypothetical protein RRG08_060614 [Elysia crispata]|uniref:NADH dehydrogenase [ubiquinone] 1 beta subcomplex subunit 5, mitochondrial n=1 Tax=Elysia crispata TaxID=231223 RepID=A0AAE1D9N9_9GAST|nr:hypothetical protein RRG08_060614 [Elysia crispata]
MVGMSLLRPSMRQLFIRLPLQKKSVLQSQISVRNAGHERKMVIIPTKFEWTQFKNDLHFYFLLGLVPMGLLITYANMFIGPAELSEIPEGYEPKEYEYYQSPIKRWMAKYIFEEPMKEYERSLHTLHVEGERRYWNMLYKKVKVLMQDRLDYRGWYWVDADKSIMDLQKELKEYNDRVIGNK